MSGIGEQFAAAREQRGMTAVDAARRLHIRAELIKAIEREDWVRVGPPSYARGFVRNYARLLGMDTDALTEQLDRAIPRARPDAIPPLEATNGEAAVQHQSDVVPAVSPFRQHAYDAARADQARSTWYPWLLGAMSMLAAVLVTAVVYYTFAPPAHEQQTLSAASSATSSSLSSLAPQDNAIFTGGNAGALIPAGPHQGVDLQLQLTQDSWLSVTVDGKRVVYETLPAGTVRDFHGVHEITLRAGNAGGVNAVIDGRPLGTLGQHGQVQDLSFAAKHTSQSIGPRE